MSKIEFETLAFQQIDNVLHVTLLKLFTTSIPTEELEQIAPFRVIDKHTLSFDKIDEDKAHTKFGFVLEKHFDTLKNKLTGNHVTYVHRNSGIPLIGNVAFGIVHRDSSIIEIKPITSCNLNCMYCSISEGISSKKNDFVVEKDYLVEELFKLIKFVNEPVEIHVGVQGEPFLYEDLIPLLEDLQENNNIHTISVDTNATLLTKEKIDSISRNNKVQLNFSLDALDENLAKKIAGVKNYNITHVKDMIAYASEKMKVIVAPVFVQGLNDTEMEKIITWIKTLPKQPRLGIQNFLRYKTGRNPAQSLVWSTFYTMLQEWEKKFDIKLQLNKEDFNVRKVKELPRPFQRDDVVPAIIKCLDRFPDTVIAVAKDRTISVANCPFVKDKRINVKLSRDKHNVFVGKVV